MQPMVVLPLNGEELRAREGHAICKSGLGLEEYRVQCLRDGARGRHLQGRKQAGGVAKTFTRDLEHWYCGWGGIYQRQGAQVSHSNKL